MNNLISIQNQDGKQLVSARELYIGLGLSKNQWSRWYKKNIQENDFFKENQDFTGVRHNVEGNEIRDFAITLEFAKHISMMTRTEKSHEYRNYFIECEQKLNDATFSTYEHELKLFSQSADAMKLARKQRIPIVLNLMHKYNISTYGLENTLSPTMIERIAHSHGVDCVDKFILERLRYSVTSCIQAIDLYDLYIAWCIKYDIKPLSMRRFGDTIKSKLVDGREILKHRRAAGLFYYGIEEVEGNE